MEWNQCTLSIPSLTRWALNRNVLLQLQLLGNEVELAFLGRVLDLLVAELDEHADFFAFSWACPKTP